ncbi:MAR-binding filament-like protein 1 isoform 1 [Quillaja saponaria]|uniref:MAR-binding filament-like protein 1 isoform 1 n=1 Tax=Quillaja saponaria TaxID=32244 RepID=A0AAD7KVZ7_QUISA|nr:MAR-binding filament-like protein 1 isoform 1 [Quillaja saponaria]
MATLSSFLSSSLPLPSFTRLRPSFSFSVSPLRCNPNPRRIRTPLVLASSFDDFSSKRWSCSADSSKKSVLATLIQEVEPLDVSHIQKDVPPTTVDAMKRTISGMLGLLPSDQFHVLIEALWEPLSKLLVSSMMTGMLLDSTNVINFRRENDSPSNLENFTEETSANFDIQSLGEISPEAQQYIHHLQSRLSSIKKELHEVKWKSAALQMQQFVGEEKNDLLDYLRSLQPEKVAELSEPTSPEVKETIHSVVHGLLATLSPKMHSKAPDLSDTTTAGAINVGGEDCAELVESLDFQALYITN